MAALVVARVVGRHGVRARSDPRSVFDHRLHWRVYRRGISCTEVVTPTVQSVTKLDGWVASFAAGLLLFLVVFIAITVVTSAVAKTAHQSTEIGSFDRAAGFAFGILRGVLVVALFVLFVRSTTTDAQGGAAVPPCRRPSSTPELTLSTRVLQLHWRRCCRRVRQRVA